MGTHVTRHSVWLVGLSHRLIDRAVGFGGEGDEEEHADQGGEAQEGGGQAVWEDLTQEAGQQIEAYAAYRGDDVKKGVDSGAHILWQVRLDGGFPDGCAGTAQAAAEEAVYEHEGKGIHKRAASMVS